MSNSPLVNALVQVLADSQALSLKTQNYHWNVEGPHFSALHALFEEHYNDLSTAIDEIAELIRGLGARTPGSWSAYDAVRSIKDGNEAASADEMVKDLADDQDKMEASLSAALKIAQEADDEVVIGALVDRMTVHRKNKWMLKSSV